MAKNLADFLSTIKAGVAHSLGAAWGLYTKNDGKILSNFF